MYEAIEQIPYGMVATYGQIARVAGLPGQPRLVGYALHATPEDLTLPWHRVINAAGRISLPLESGQYDLQKSLLEAEGIRFRGEKVSLARYQWPLLARA
ncbi:MAG TPA: methylated-DNA--[protein]-cysteine S-methyltransferase [Calditrichia bacterium]|nr:methylated-DNA--[protein]-cysteine S-methyltransferase [Calditrichia bacterium]HQV33845.1 methylated-DNA--[protein]-cysteine S-methyltransferase [Calditrichia bacterium]